jgi:hypothetical protein
VACPGRAAAGGLAVSEPRWVLAFEPMPSRPGEPDPAARIRRLLKYAARALRLRCVSVAAPPADPLAWVGWLLREGRGWEKVCTHHDREACGRVLAEHGPAEARVVLPRGKAPG